jgi:hypothetical protein
MFKKIILAFAILLLASPSYAVDWCADSANRGCWGMENSGTEIDLSSNGADLTESSGTIPQDADAQFGSFSRDFELGDTEFLFMADGGSTDISGADQSLTIVTWVKFESLPATGTNYVLVAKYLTTTANRQYDLRLNETSGQNFECILSNDGTAAVIAIGATVATTGVWYHVACVYDDTDIRIYVNGDLDSNGADNPKAHTTGIFNGTGQFSIGAVNTSTTPTGFSDLLKDDTAVFNEAKS